MNETEMISLFRQQVKACPESELNDTNARILLNEGIKIFVEHTKALPTYTTFTSVSSQLRYNLATLITDFLCPSSNGLYYYDGTDYENIEYITREYLDDNHSDWLTATAGEPERAFIDGDELTLNPPVGTGRANGILIYYCKKPPALDGNTNIYPFGGTVEIPRLSPYHLVIVDFLIWKAYEILDINEPNSVRRSRAKQNFYDGLTWAEGRLKNYVNSILNRGRRTRLKLKSSYSDSPFK